MKRKVIVELSGSESLRSNFEAAISGNFSKISKSALPILPGLALDNSFPPVQMATYEEGDYDEKNLFDTTRTRNLSLNTDNATYIVRGEMTEKDAKELIKKRNVVGVFSDPIIKPCITCSGPAVGDDKDVEKLLSIVNLRKCKMTGKGVRVAIVDTGVNMAYMNSRGKNPMFDAANSWKPASSSVVPGSAPVGHGTMCAYDVCIAAPDCTILDIALLTTQNTGPTVMAGFLSDAILAYRHLLQVKNAPSRPGENQSLVVNNSWGMFHPSWDYPVGHPGNYSDNPNHPFHKMVITLERAGADILFAAGNCGSDCPDGRCRGVTHRPIYGANSSPYVLSVAGADVNKDRVGYSSQGPGRLTLKKPDITGYTHFDGSGVYAADGGTSAACPVVAGVVAAIRTIRPYQPGSSITSPSAIRNLVTSTAIDRGTSGYDYDYGYGIINSLEIARKICGNDVYDLKRCIKLLCKRYPRLCKYLMYCYRNPKKCQLSRPVRPRQHFDQGEFDFIDEIEENELEELLEQFDGSMIENDQDTKNEDCQCK